MKNKKDFYIDGKWVKSKSNDEIKVINPATEENCAVISLGNKDDVDFAVSSAKKAYSHWSFSTKDERIKLLEKLYENYKKNESLLKDFQKKKLLNDFLILENNKLRELIKESVQSKDIYAKVLIDKDSPYLKSIILNKGSKDKVKLGMAIVDDVYLVGKIIEVNFTNSRALLFGI